MECATNSAIYVGSLASSGGSFGGKFSCYGVYLSIGLNRSSDIRKECNERAVETGVVTSIISSLTALAAVIVSPYATFQAQKRSMLGPMRQAWINGLRDSVAEFMAIVSEPLLQAVAALSLDDSVRQTAETATQSKVEVAYRLKEKICLMTNPHETEHRELVRLVETAFDKWKNNSDTSTALLALRHHTQAILKTEWNVVKK